MSARHPNVKKLREYQRWRRGGDRPQMSPAEVSDALDWAIAVCEAADRVVNGKGRNPEKNYLLLEAAVRAQ